MNFFKNLINKITRKTNETAVAVTEKTYTPAAVLTNNRGDGYVSDGLFS